MPLFAVIQFPDIDPVLLHIWGPVAIRWYALSYIAGIVLGWWHLRALITRPALWSPLGVQGPIANKTQIDDFIVWATLGVLLGGRIGWIVFYELVKHPEELVANPLRALYVWQGGMNFHGGLIGVILALIVFCRRNGIDPIRFGDGLACAVPFGLCFGRIANFINAEIVGKVSDAPWAVIFCNARMKANNGGVCPPGLDSPRLPVQLYEAFLEGVVIFLILVALTRFYKGLRRPGLAVGVFLIAYAAFRIFIEVMFRDSDNKLGGGWTLGIALSLPMPIAGFLFLWNSFQDRLGPVPFAKTIAQLTGAGLARSKTAGKPT